jgi:GT2 family glycosyltransferase
MWERVVDSVVEVYSNTSLQHPFNLVDKFNCKIPLKRPSNISSIKLFFGTYRKACKGTLSIQVSSDTSTSPIKFSIDLIEVQDNSPVDLLLDLPLYCGKEVRVSMGIELLREEDKLAVWLNPVGICAVVRGTVEKKYSFNYVPKISIVTPVYKTNLSFLTDAVQSVKNQIYDNWELILVDDCSEQEQLTKYLKSFKKDKRIKYLANKENGGIAISTNVGIGKATGDYVAFLDHDDLLDSQALLKVVSYLNDHPDTDLVYTDEDKVTEEGVYYGPFYKPDWNYNIFLSQMYTCHLSVYRNKLLKEIGGIREGYDGSQDYDLALRFIEKTIKIGHVPEVLYHWRSCEGSTAQGIQNKPRARISAVRAISEHLERVGRKARVCSGPFQGHYHVDYLLEKEPLVSVIIPFRDKVSYLETLLYTMKLTDYKNYEIILVDNGSVEKETLDFLAGLGDDVKVISYDLPFNFSAVNNFAVRSGVCRGELVLFLNNDMEVMHPEWVTELVKQFTLEKVSVVGGKLLYLNHQIQHAGIFVGVNGVAGHSHKKMYDYMPGYYSRPHIVQEVTAVTGACMMVKKSAFLEVDGFDEEFPRAFNDIDLCLTLRSRGDLIVYTPYCRLYHLESMSRGIDGAKDPIFTAAIRRMESKWDVFNFKDPYYNPNLPINCEGLR